jgi:RNA polymerase sigma factor (sigma-70 family)
MEFANLYRRNVRRLERTVSRLLGSADNAKDIVHDAFLRAYVAELGDRTELSSALLTVTARRLALNEIRNRTRRATDTMGDMSALGVYSNDDQVAALEGAQLRDSIEAAMAAMPAQCRRVFQMRKVDELSHAEIGGALGISKKTVERHVTKAISICRARLIADGHLPAPGRFIAGQNE